MKEPWYFIGSCAIAAVVIGAGFLLCHVFHLDVDMASWVVGYLSAIVALTMIILHGGLRGRCRAGMGRVGVCPVLPILFIWLFGMGK